MAVIHSPKASVASTSTPALASAEEVPSYEEATNSRPPQAQVQNNNGKGNPSSSPSQSDNATTDHHSQRLYPFPSLGTEREGYGQSPYQPDGTLRIPIGSSTNVTNVNGDPLLPFPGSQSRRGPRAGRRFCVAFFWAVILYMCIVSIYVGLDGNHIHSPDTHPPTKGGPPGWHHHHGHNDESRKHRQSDGRRIAKRSFSLSSWQSQ